MAGHRRRRDPGEELRPTLRQSRPATRRAKLMVRYAAADAAARLAVAVDYLRGAAARRHPDQDRADEILGAVTTSIIAAGDELLALQAREAVSFRVREPVR
jgi:hypothetical protein